MSRLRLLWAQASNSLWLIPALCTIAAVALALGMVAIDRANVINDTTLRFTFGAGAAGARGVLSTIAGSIITVTGVVFSITIVALQLASSQFTPRVLRSFTGDRVNQWVLGVFIGTFTYALLVLRTVRSSLEDLESFVPSLSVTLAVLLALVSIGFLIYFINHIARSIQAEVILDRVARDALQIVDALFPEELGQPADEPASLRPQTASMQAVRSRASGYVQGVDEDLIMQLAVEHDTVILLQPRIGDFVMQDDELARVEGSDVRSDVQDKLRSAITVGHERTRYQDVERGIIELTDIGVRALSPGLNDPTTALVCIDRVMEIMARLGQRRMPSRERAGDDGKLRVIAHRPAWPDLVHLAYAGLRHYSRTHPGVAIALARSLVRLLDIVPEQRRPPLHEQLHALVAAAYSDWDKGDDLRRLDAAVGAASRPDVVGADT
jgi:uncharacterized membrane protein